MMRNGKAKIWSIVASAVGIVSIAGGVALAQVGGSSVGAPTFTDNPSPFPYVHTGVGGTGTQLTGGQLITFQGTMGSGDFFQQEFVTINSQPTIHTMLEGNTGTTNKFVQESFVLMGAQRTPLVQNNTPAPILPAPPANSQIAFRQVVQDSGFSSTASLEPGADIHIHQQVAGVDTTNNQSGGLSFSNIDILPNKTGPNGAANPGGPSCGTTPVFCTTVSQQVSVAQGSTVLFSQNLDFTSGPTGVNLPTIVQGP